MRTLAPAVECQTPQASKTPSPPPQKRSRASEAMADFASIRNRQILDRATPRRRRRATRSPLIWEWRHGARRRRITSTLSKFQFDRCSP
jgi:hypothetical protein